jgi:hypothetical protein
MRRILKVLVAAAFMVVLLVTVASPAFADHNGRRHFGYGPGAYHYYGGQEECLYGNATHNPNKEGYSYHCRLA